jgi:hypothetical protein
LPPSTLTWLFAAVPQVVSRCISQQVDLLGVLGQLAFSLPELEDAAYEAKATSAVEALLKDMEVAQVSHWQGRGEGWGRKLHSLLGCHTLMPAARCFA